jgi:outer membrane protein assembly factor BamB
MGTSRGKLLTTFVVLPILAVSVLAKRVPPKPVSPVISDGIRYSTEGDGRDQYVVAGDTSSGNELWRGKVFHNRIKFWREEDVQWVFITDLKLVDNSLLIRDERSRCYSVDLTTRQVKKQECGGFVSQ